ncbi:RHS repeat protein, partial [Pseudomonas sp. FSL R10-0399]
PLRFQGQYFDTETGLHYNRYRYYDPQVGRFISKDPIGFAGGLNVYAYAPNPVGWVDPFGLSSCPCERDCEKILADAGLDVDTHSNLTKRNKGTQYDSHHIYQDNTVASVPGYNRNSAIAITLQGRNADRTTRGSQHYNASQAQNNSSSGGLVGSETVVAFKALRSAGIGSHESKCAVLKARGYLGGLGASAGTTTNLPQNRRGR